MGEELSNLPKFTQPQSEYRFHYKKPKQCLASLAGLPSWAGEAQPPTALNGRTLHKHGGCYTISWVAGCLFSKRWREGWSLHCLQPLGLPALCSIIGRSVLLDFHYNLISCSKHFLIVSLPCYHNKSKKIYLLIYLPVPLAISKRIKFWSFSQVHPPLSHFQNPVFAAAPGLLTIVLFLSWFSPLHLFLISPPLAIYFLSILSLLACRILPEPPSFHVS